MYERIISIPFYHHTEILSKLTRSNIIVSLGGFWNLNIGAVNKTSPLHNLAAILGFLFHSTSIYFSGSPF